MESCCDNPGYDPLDPRDAPEPYEEMKMNTETKNWRMWEVMNGNTTYERAYATAKDAKRAADRRRAKTGRPHMYEHRNAVAPASHWRY